jgi:glucose-6-phosphate 1-dehydrogenase
MVSRVIPVDPFDLVIFGGTGDLARRKILPALFRRFCDGQMPPEARIIGAARTQQSAAGLGSLGRRGAGGIRPAKRSPIRQHVAEFLERLDYLAVDAKGEGGWSDLCDKMRPMRCRRSISRSRRPVRRPGGAAAPVQDRPARCADRCGKALRQRSGLGQGAEPDAVGVFRRDADLPDRPLPGKETVQNLMAVRFGNVLFEPLWNTQYVDHVQITVAEEVGVGGRGAYYDQSGAMRDMVQNHLMQLLCLTAMEPPSKFDPDAVRDEKLKVIRALDPVAPEDIVRGQYKGTEDAPSYLEDAENPDSRTESFIALKLHVSNWRWNGTPFYLRTGKRLKARQVRDRDPFQGAAPFDLRRGCGQPANVLSIRLQPDEGIDLRVTIKEPGPGGMRLMDVPLDMSFADALGADGVDVPDAYERLIMDVIRGNQTLFMRGDEVEAAWAWTDPIIEGWTRRGDRPVAIRAGSSGPEEALMLLHRDGRRWREIG